MGKFEDSYPTFQDWALNPYDCKREILVNFYFIIDYVLTKQDDKTWKSFLKIFLSQ